ncbi:hypothetical protein [Micromonospora cathayae]|uniref:Uncharacterized protein n=1 Tax=Micromonospora cathayae TaxID=3028804 RepID=A0ABY7ZIA7_9ACTN|nr:hypothetical protein [Micromonospora sp. HUAS 3]WDZ82671.1 hypothetical protein PVK37_19580 [Micromonospora sp. HUAS 3]
MPSERRDVTAELPGKRMAAGLLITDADERVPLVEPVCKAEWEVGGTLDAGATKRIVVPRGESTGWAWADPLPTARRLPPLLARRVAEALCARADGCCHLEVGVRVT